MSVFPNNADATVGWCSFRVLVLLPTTVGITGATQPWQRDLLMFAMSLPLKEGKKTVFGRSEVKPGCRLSTLMGDFNCPYCCDLQPENLL